MSRTFSLVLLSLLMALPAASEEPSFRVGALVFGDYTYTAQQQPPARDANGNEIHPNAFNVTRAYINLLGTLNKYVSLRVTPDIARESGSGSSLSGSQSYRLKYAYAQLELQQWLTKGSWLRAGLTQTPLLDFEESFYRYRFQGPLFADREGFLISSDYGVSLHYNLPGELGDIQTGVFNGEGYAHSEQNDQKAFQFRAALRPLPHLRIGGFVDHDAYARGLDRKRVIGQIILEHPRGNAGFDVLHARDQRTAASSLERARGYTVWVTPNITPRWGALLRYDRLRPGSSTSLTKRRDIEGIAYWLAMAKGVTSALMLDRDATRTSAGDRTTNLGLKMMLSF